MTGAPLSIGYATVGDPHNRRTWSGTIWQMARALEGQGADMQYFGPMDTRPLWREKLTRRVKTRLGQTTLQPSSTRRATDSFARQILEKAQAHKPDLIYAPAGTHVIARLPRSLPVAYFSDTTARLMQNYYPDRAALPARDLRLIDQIEAEAIARADLLIFPTEWAARSAVQDYGVDAARVHVVAIGANTPAPAREQALAARPDGPLRLIFVGVEWARKGGDIAVAALDNLNARGIDAHLTVIGCTPPTPALREAMHVIPFLDKNDTAERAQLQAEYLAADLLLLPTRQECYGIVFCEAAAHGLPSISTATGGVPDVIREAVTGYTLPIEAEGAEYADTIATIVETPGGLEALRTSARDDYDARLNWTVWAQSTKTLMSDLIADRA